MSQQINHAHIVQWTSSIRKGYKNGETFHEFDRYNYVDFRFQWRDERHCSSQLKETKHLQFIEETKMNTGIVTWLQGVQWTHLHLPKKIVIRCLLTISFHQGISTTGVRYLLIAERDSEPIRAEPFEIFAHSKCRAQPKFLPHSKHSQLVYFVIFFLFYFECFFIYLFHYYLHCSKHFPNNFKVSSNKIVTCKQSEFQGLVWFGLVLWHINDCWLFKAESFLYIYTEYMFWKHVF